MSPRALEPTLNTRRRPHAAMKTHAAKTERRQPPRFDEPSPLASVGNKQKREAEARCRPVYPDLREPEPPCAVGALVLALALAAQEVPSLHLSLYRQGPTDGEIRRSQKVTEGRGCPAAAAHSWTPAGLL